MTSKKVNAQKSAANLSQHMGKEIGRKPGQPSQQGQLGQEMSQHTAPVMTDVVVDVNDNDKEYSLFSSVSVSSLTLCTQSDDLP